MKVNVALIQMSCSMDIKLNINKAVAMVEEAATRGANIVCLQELYASRYFPQTVNVKHYQLAHPLDGEPVETMRWLAADKKLVMVVPVYEYAKPGIYFNTAVVVDADGSIAGKFRKVHIPEGPQYLEKYYFTPGNLGYPVFKTAYATIGVGICWDEWFPEVARILSLKGAQIIFYPSAIGSEPDRPGYSSQGAWETVIKSHGIANGLFVAAVNRVGVEDDMTFYGGSFISNPFGEILARGGSEDQVVAAELDLNQIEEFRNLLQFHRDRRPETYHEILKLIVE
ncbi:N-carbamoylputrescine amidase [Desulfofundulus thermobenzoicus]|uniref:N-carbamoylputrescine amidase n=1 Tax=Desulfofundulus thermobenzoicus TaxID=29376 RepID=A0A6N7ILB0_9FIRM|nr:carbon-nitrogen hydrolase [Desulfofundulus thermobenzoicus]MQL50731.1 N-carbamoylputrescine amidase [Desulfofundulus thermobenzoicus]